MMSGYRSTRTTLCVLAGLGALTGGVAGAAIVGKLATDGSVRDAAARDGQAAAPSTQATQVAAVAAQSVSRLPTPWSAADTKAVRAAVEHQRASQQAASKPAPRRAAVRPARTSAPRASVPAGNRVIRVKQTGASPRPVTAAPRPSVPVRPPVPAQRPARAPAPVRAPEPAPRTSRPAPEQAPARSSPKPDPTGAFDDSG